MLDNTEKELLYSINFEEEVAQIIKTKFSTNFSKYHYENDETKLITLGISFKIQSNDNLLNDILEIREKIKDKGYFIFISQSNLFDKPISNIISIIKADNVYEVIEKIGTSAPNYDLETIDIINKLKEWEKISSFNIFEITPDSIGVVFNKLPEDLSSFAKDVYEFCPDTLDQGYYGDELEEDEDFEEAFDEQTSETLAEYFKKNKDLFLWWD